MDTLHHLALDKSYSHKAIAWVYGISLVLIFSISTFFHVISLSGRLRNLRHILHLCDRGIIYFFIAASYMPWLVLRDVGIWGDRLSWLLWIGAIMGTLYNCIFHEKYKTLETVFYLMFGVLPSLPLIFQASDTAGLIEVALGGAFYIGGVYFFKSDGKITFAHAIWHVFCATGACLHFYAVYTHLY
ncbi:monocyte to macrophage differentiation factor-like isoform X2 [Actinia tenebrosa]|nr:monocyte to macrophage differentiation factor-like isoform X2 [Actinia tenebrosa]XP_031560173.1 monocyte to macrophage differentiation factor-like isoform X2 [Actinia tenebrosa]XP_031560174.1 monocyte to macrophage differentiation factor-like isoform X2 [Actinia tenebrosa]XP_031560175.1 monocyte to macrophage differentiation factor-like isoform X2 [Actinia tenebrosa]